jgi:hydrogenase-4 component B
MQYTASSYARPLVILFRWLVGTRLSVRGPRGPLPESADLESHTPDIVAEGFFRPAFAGLVWIASKVRWFQRGQLQLYVLYIALTILALMIWKLG